MTATLSDHQVRSRVEIYLRFRKLGAEYRNMNIFYDCCPNQLDTQMTAIAQEAKSDSTHEFHEWAEEWLADTSIAL
jgi:hypothetical protein